MLSNDGSGRTRRSAAINSNKAWESLKVSKKGASTAAADEEEELSNSKSLDEDFEAPGVVKPKRKYVKRSIQSSNNNNEPGVDEELEPSHNNNKKPRVNKRSLAKKADAELPELNQEALHNNNVALSVKSPDSKAPSSPKKSPLKESKSLPKAGVQPEKPTVSPKSVPTAALSKVAPYSASQIISFKPSQGAMNKEQLEKIAMEVDKHHFENDDEDEYENDELDNAPQRYVLDDPEDEDYIEGPVRGQKRVGILRKPARGGLGPGGIPYSQIASSVSSAPARSTPSNRGRGRPPGLVNPALSRSTNLMNTSYSRASIAPTLNYQPQMVLQQQRPSGGAPTVKVLRFRSQLGGNYQPSSSNTQNSLNVKHSVNTMTANINKEIEDTAEYFKNQARLAPKNTVNEFNALVNSLTEEIERLSQELSNVTANNREYVKKLNATHSAEIEAKDNRIQQLQATTELLQSKLNLTFKRCQLNVLKHEANGAEISTSIRVIGPKSAQSGAAPIQSPHPSTNIQQCDEQMDLSMHSNKDEFSSTFQHPNENALISGKEALGQRVLMPADFKKSKNAVNRPMHKWESDFLIENLQAFMDSQSAASSSKSNEKTSFDQGDSGSPTHGEGVSNLIKDPNIITPNDFQRNDIPFMIQTDTKFSTLKSTRVISRLINCFVVGGECRLIFEQVTAIIFPQIPKFAIDKAMQDLNITNAHACSEQIMILKEAGKIPQSLSTCSLITKTNCERLIALLLKRCYKVVGERESQSILVNFGKYRVAHDCFGGCNGRLYSNIAPDPCIECCECAQVFLPESFVRHSHLDNTSSNLQHWGFDTANWNFYLRLAEEITESPCYEQRKSLFDLFMQNYNQYRQPTANRNSSTSSPSS